MSDMTLDQYQNRATATAIYPLTASVTYPALGLSGEAGEVAEHVKKALRDDDGMITEDRRAAMKKEIGDVLWYVAILSRDLGFRLDDIAKANLEKLRSRSDRGRLGGSGDDR